jgi:hypothetical protein
VGALKRKNEAKQKGADSKQKVGEEYDVALIMSAVENENISKIDKNIWKLKSSGYSGQISEYDENSTKNLVYSYLSFISECQEISNFIF